MFAMLLLLPITTLTRVRTFRGVTYIGYLVTARFLKFRLRVWHTLSSAFQCLTGNIVVQNVFFIAMSEKNK